ncbi:protein E31B [Elephant endotheliotropic herpesvirus 5B]|nr:protein E31B [Elephant endotheliotropic herpesvirus 5B]
MRTKRLKVIIMTKLIMRILKNEDTYMNIRYSADCTKILEELDNYLETPLLYNRDDGNSSSIDTPPPLETSDDGDENLVVLTDLITTSASTSCQELEDQEDTERIYLPRDFPLLSEDIPCYETNVELSQRKWVGTNDTTPSDENPVNPEKEGSGCLSESSEQETLYQSQTHIRPVYLRFDEDTKEDQDEPCRLHRSPGFYGKNKYRSKKRVFGNGLGRWRLVGVEPPEPCHVDTGYFE